MFPFFIYFRSKGCKVLDMVIPTTVSFDGENYQCKLITFAQSYQLNHRSVWVTYSMTISQQFGQALNLFKEMLSVFDRRLGCRNQAAGHNTKEEKK